MEDQGRREIVRQSQSDCMKEVIDHLELYLNHNPRGTAYEDWVAALHPDNAEYADGSIDHRFYVEDSDHRLLWNKCMEERDLLERIVDANSLEPNYNRTH